MKTKQSSVVAPVFRYFKNVSQWLLLALCVIGGARSNFRSRRTSCPTEANAGAGEFDPKLPRRA
jgi:hypothetical protein